MVLRICRDYWPFSKSIKNVQFRFQIALLAVLFTAPFLKFMTSNSGLCSEAKGSEKKPKLARIAVGKVIVESPVVSCSVCFLFVRSGVGAVLFMAPFLKFLTSNSGLCSEFKRSKKKPNLATIAVEVNACLI